MTHSVIGDNLVPKVASGLRPDFNRQPQVIVTLIGIQVAAQRADAFLPDLPLAPYRHPTADPHKRVALRSPPMEWFTKSIQKPVFIAEDPAQDSVGKTTTPTTPTFLAASQESPSTCCATTANQANRIDSTESPFQGVKHDHSKASTNLIHQ